MGFEKLVATLEKEAAAKEEAELTRARSEADAIMQAARKEVAALSEQLNRAHARHTERAHALQVASRKLEKRHTRVALEHAITEALKAECRELFANFMVGDAYTGHLSSQFNTASAELGGISSVSADARSAEILATLALGAELRVDASILGFVATSQDGTRKIHCTFEKAYEKLFARVGAETLRKIAEGIPDAH